MPANPHPLLAHLSAGSDEGPDALHTCRILLVDDDDLVRARLAALLRQSNYEVEVAASGEEALRLMSTSAFQMVITDWEMPEMDGLALCRCVRVSQDQGYVYLLMLTVRASPEDLAAGFAAGADDYVVKGAPINEILARLEVGRRIVYVERSLRASRANLQLAFTDPVTNTHNLRYFLLQLPRELARSRRYLHPLAVLTCEMEGLDQIQARHGFETAAALLRAFVNRAANCLRTSSDWLARTGRSEFTIVLPETKTFGANRVLEKLQRAFGFEPVATPTGPLPLATRISVTAVEDGRAPGSALRLESLMQSASRALRSGETRSATDSPLPAFDALRIGKHGLN